jgi:leucyl-tRNA synthetase
MGHVRNYTIGDALAWFRRMQDYNVLHPMGWDSLGLPAENAAIQRGADPREWTLANIAAMKAQLRRLGFSYAWEREVTTCEPEYYRWNQWFFLKLLERGLASGPADPQLRPVRRSANEQVVDGFCWRHDDTPVEPREMDQWFGRTACAD